MSNAAKDQRPEQWHPVQGILREAVEQSERGDPMMYDRWTYAICAMFAPPSSPNQPTVGGVIDDLSRMVLTMVAHLPEEIWEEVAGSIKAYVESSEATIAVQSAELEKLRLEVHPLRLQNLSVKMNSCPCHPVVCDACVEAQAEYTRLVEARKALAPTPPEATIADLQAQLKAMEGRALRAEVIPLQTKEAVDHPFDQITKQERDDLAAKRSRLAELEAEQLPNRKELGDRS